MRKWMFYASLFFSLNVNGAEADSIKVENLLKDALSLPTDSCRTLHFARQLVGTPYVAGTLDTSLEEQLVVHLDKVDCTTFVETVLALAIADKQTHRNYQAFKDALASIRYRNGELDGYASRLHYFSDWIKDNERKGLIKEYTSNLPNIRKRLLSLDFMTTHVQSYPQLKADSSLVKAMNEVESAWKRIETTYLPKEFLNLSSDELPIKSGDIIAITTSIEGLDVVHVGYACWVGEKLHLLHASSNAMKVILDELPLYDYSKNKKAHTGVRAISFIQ
ncbi:MAG: DUF1460 domain-containing protein [Bacteroidaceae bacterium]|nr:DUF1460 domain-containing protein [Bacteroidaceae bacterium]